MPKRRRAGQLGPTLTAAVAAEAKCSELVARRIIGIVVHAVREDLREAAAALDTIEKRNHADPDVVTIGYDSDAIHLRSLATRLTFAVDRLINRRHAEVGD